MAAEEVNKLPPLPPYPQMILQAIEALNEKNGSNKTSISKYIESKYGHLPAGHTALLAHHLNRMKDSGELVFWKNNYMKHDPGAPPRRGRGRPPKPKGPLPPGAILSPARPRGRPPKDPNAPPKPVKPKVATGSGKPRGRPRKMARPSGGISGSSTTTATVTTTGRGRGRPPKVKAPLTEDSGELVVWKNNYMKHDPNVPPQRGRGRPPKPKSPLPLGATLAPARPRGRPRKDSNASPKPLKAKVATGSGKPRGRPRKIARPSGGISRSSTTTATVRTTRKGRGQPPKVKAP